jgi:acyl-CoA thioesterase
MTDYAEDVAGRSSVSFDRDTALEPIGLSTFEGRLEPRWWIGRGPHGGYVGALVLRAMTLSLDDPGRAPRSFTVHFANAPANGRVTISCALERSGRSLSTVSARMTQGETLIALALGAFSLPREGAERNDARMPETPAPEELEPLPRGEGSIASFMENFDMRWAIGAPPGSGAPVALAGGWIRMADPQPPDPVHVTCLMDAWPPPLFSSTRERFAAPTIELTVHFLAPLPPPDAEPGDFYLGSFETRTVFEGFFEEEGELWTRDGRLLARSRQLAIVLPLRERAR